MEQTNEQAVLPTAIEMPKVDIKMTPEEILNQINVYKANADESLGKLQQNIDKLADQLQNLQKMKLMVLGQREVVLDLLTKMTTQKEVTNG
ncbi:hypothetical protein CCP3SC5AM1_880008 [Gammaproteobacteria bacterium]